VSDDYCIPWNGTDWGLRVRNPFHDSIPEFLWREYTLNKIYLVGGVPIEDTVEDTESLPSNERLLWL
jgi:hypothetical protein